MITLKLHTPAELMRDWRIRNPDRAKNAVKRQIEARKLARAKAKSEYNSQKR